VLCVVCMCVCGGGGVSPISGSLILLKNDPSAVNIKVPANTQCGEGKLLQCVCPAACLRRRKLCDHPQTIMRVPLFAPGTTVLFPVERDLSRL